MYSKTCVKRPLSKRPKIGFHDQLLLNAGQKYRRMHSAILSTFIKLAFVIKIFFVYFRVAVIHRFYGTRQKTCACLHRSYIVCIFSASVSTQQS